MSYRPKENSQHLMNINPSSTYRVEADQKDLLIRNMKQEIELLKKNQQEYYSLSDQYQQLQHKLKILVDDKESEDKEYRMRHEAAGRSIAQLKAEIDALKTEFREKRGETTDLQSDRCSLQDHLDCKALELQSLKSDFQNHMADGEQLMREHDSLLASLNKLKEINATIKEEHNNLQMDCDSVARRTTDLDKYCDQLIIQEKLLRDKIQHYQDENNEADKDIAVINNSIIELETGIRKAQSDISQLQRIIAEMTSQNQKLKTQITHAQKSIQSQAMNNNNILKQLKSSQNTLKVRKGQLHQGNVHVTQLKQQCESITQINSKLQQDLQACRRHLQNLGLINHKLVEDMEAWTEQNERVREMIDKKAKTEKARSRVTQVQSISASRGKDKYTQETRMGTSRRTYRY